jgi:hypothetical protein
MKELIATARCAAEQIVKMMCEADGRKMIHARRAILFLRATLGSAASFASMISVEPC